MIFTSNYETGDGKFFPQNLWKKNLVGKRKICKMKFFVIIVFSFLPGTVFDFFFVYNVCFTKNWADFFELFLFQKFVNSIIKKSRPSPVFSVSMLLGLRNRKCNRESCNSIEKWGVVLHCVIMSLHVITEKMHAFNKYSNIFVLLSRH